MQRRLGSRLAALAAAAALAAPAAADAPAADDGTLAFVHVAANVGGASGGHSALRLGSRVYHYQLDDDAGGERLLQLERVDWEVFRFRYNVLENRPLELAHLETPAGARRALADRFTSVWLQQRRERAVLAELERDIALLEATLGRRAGVPTPGAGLFDPHAAPPPGARALARRLAKVRDAHPEAAQDVAALAAGPGAEQRYREALALGFARRMLREGRPLASDAWLAVPGPELRPDERRSLRRLQRALEGAMARLLADRLRPDRAQPLLVALARHRAAARSLATGRLHLVDPFPTDAPRLEGRELRRRRPELEAVAGFLEGRVQAERAALLHGGAPHEHDLARLEVLAARAREVRRGAQQGLAVREPGDLHLPRRSGELAVPAPAPTGAVARLAALEARRLALRDARRARWRYDLFARGGENCVSELGNTVNAALEDPAAALGGRIDPERWLRFWPRVFFRDVRHELAVARVEVLPAHRLRLRARLLEGLDTGPGRVAARLRESNTVTSALYTPRDPDGSFLFFTDDRTWTRPLLGAVNLGWAGADALAGLATAPFDGGDRLLRAGRGALFSLPELVFVNIRKGSFDAATLPASPGAD